MKSRFRHLERLQAAARRRLPAIAAAWLAPLRAEIESLATAALRDDIPDAEIIRRIQAIHHRAPDLLTQLDITPLASTLQDATAAALINGIASHPTHR